MIEWFCLAIMVFAMGGAFLSFFPQWKPTNETLGDIWDVYTNITVATIVFIIGFILLFLLG